MLEEWIAAIVSIIIICTATALSIIIILNNDHRDNYADTEPGRKWFVEIWNIRHGVKIELVFYSTITLGRYSLYTGVKEMQQIPEDTSVSREHLLLYDQGGALWAWNLSAVNPAKINGHRLNEPQRLHMGNRLELGNSVFLVTKVRCE